MVTMMSYIGNKGHTIYKSSLSKKELDKLKDELTVSPFSAMTIGKPPKFPIYRENADKIYIPRFFENDVIKQPSLIKLNEGTDISLNFIGGLREYQENIINTFMNKVSKCKSGGLLEIPCGRGKTVMALNIISKIQKKTLVIVHKSFLLNQWVERIGQFLPTAKIGTIQGQVIDVDGKDIVIGMLQTLSMKDFPKTLFEAFGLTIVDEVHHIAAEVFVRSLFKIVSPIMLGLSATMNRNDGLSYVFKMFIGPVIYKEKRETDDNVIIKVYQYYSNDPEYNDVVYDFRGNPQYSTMISKLCNHEPRTEYIINILKEIIDKDVENKEQIIVLAHNKNVLKYLYETINERKIAPVGYYVGGMKEPQLKESESKKVVIGTYSMASEALDIKTLTTLVMVTPKTAIEQSIGRILRTKHSQPLVVDIVDQHTVFKRQFDKRMSFYKKQKYKVIENHNLYNGVWKTIYDPNDPAFNKPKKITSKTTSIQNLLESCGLKNKTDITKYDCNPISYGDEPKCMINLSKL
jgi:superfamily II DNA or RNA helicase